MKMEDRIYKLLQLIKEQPEKFLGRKSLNDLYFYLLGYAQREFEATGNYPEFLSQFKAFIRKKYNMVTDALTWVEIISFYSFSEAEAFDSFYKHLDEFLTLQEV